MPTTSFKYLQQTPRKSLRLFVANVANSLATPPFVSMVYTSPTTRFTLSGNSCSTRSGDIRSVRLLIWVCNMKPVNRVEEILLEPRQQVLFNLDILHLRRLGRQSPSRSGKIAVANKPSEGSGTVLKYSASRAVTLASQDRQHLLQVSGLFSTLSNTFHVSDNRYE